jgi:hypothetical protein
MSPTTSTPPDGRPPEIERGGDGARPAAARPPAGRTARPKGAGPRSADGGKRATRGGPKGRWRRLGERFGEQWSRLLEIPAVWAAVLLLLGTWLLTPGSLIFAPEVTPDSIAQRDYIAPEETLVPDPDATLEKQRRAREEVLPVYDFDTATVAERDQAFARLFAAGRRLMGSDPDRLRRAEDWRQALADRLSEESALRVTPQQAAVLTAWAFTNDLEDRVRSVVRQALRRGAVNAKDLLLENRMRGVTLRDLSSGEEREHFDLFDHLGYPDEVRDFLEAEVRDWLGLTGEERQAMVELMLANLPPNLHPNRSETMARREVAAAEATPAFSRISKGEVIVRKGDRVDAATAVLISEISGRRGWSRRLVPMAGTLVLLGLAALALWVALGREKTSGQSRRRIYAESVLVLVVAVAGSKLCFLTATALAASFDASWLTAQSSYLWAVPFAALALVTALLLGRYPALILAGLYSILVSQLAGDDGAAIILYAFAGSLAAVYALERYQFKQRLVLMRVGLLVAAVNVVVIVALLAAHGDADTSPARLAFDLVCGFTGGLLVAAAAGFAVPVLESMLGIATDIKLVELANTNLPLLRRLAFEAPGTFQHSLMVANLAKEGCEAVDADATLAYTGALYHDIGKVFRPDYFIENQRPGQNRHDKLAPSMSALILINHIKDGVELARQHHLPRPIVDAIEQHHGTRLIKYFYNRALERCDPDTEEVREDEYRYPGPKPRDKVMGILMLADGIEAASRTLVEPTPVKVRTLIRTIMDDCLRDGQLDHTDLTLSDLRRVADAFNRVLATIFHQRIDYPGFDFNAQPRRERPALAEPARAS